MSYSAHSIRNLQCVGYPTILKALVKSKVRSPEWDIFNVPKHSRRLDDRIRELCGKLVASTEHQDVDHILSELKVALHESIERLRIRVAAALTGAATSKTGAKPLEPECPDFVTGSKQVISAIGICEKLSSVRTRRQ